MSITEIEFFLGLLFIGLSSSYSNRVFTTDLFKLVFGIILFVLSLMKVAITG